MRTKNKDKELNHRHFIGLRLTDVELDLLDQGAACLSISRSEYLRKLLLEKQINHQIEVVFTFDGEDEDAACEAVSKFMKENL